MSGITIDLHHRVFTPANIKEIIRKLTDRSAVRLCQASKCGFYYTNLYRKEALEQYSQAVEAEKELFTTDYFYLKFYTITDAQKHAEMEKQCIANIRDAMKNEANPEMIKEIEEEIYWAERHATSIFVLKSEYYVGLSPSLE